jgi:hypothetical protein
LGRQELAKRKNQLDRIQDYLVGIDCLGSRCHGRIFKELPRTLLDFIGEKINSLVIDATPGPQDDENNLYMNLNLTANTFQFDCSDLEQNLG